MVMLKACTRKRKDKRRSGSRHNLKRDKKKYEKKVTKREKNTNIGFFLRKEN
jgi:hypothetical protein